MTQTISSEKLYAFLISTPSIVNKAIVTLMYSSALSGAAIRNLKVKHLIDACDEYFRIKEERTVENLLRKNIEIMIPCWRDESSSGVKITFSSPESLFYIFLHLQERFNSDGVDVDDYLFVNSKGNQISANDITDLFKKSAKLNKMLPKGYRWSSKFSSKDLKKNFIFFCEKQLPDEMYAKKSFIDLLTGTAKKDNYWYEESLRYIEPLRMYYRFVLPYVTAKNYEHQYNLYDNFDIELPEKKNEKIPENKIDEFVDYYINKEFSKEIFNSKKYELFKNVLEIMESDESDEDKEIQLGYLERSIILADPTIMNEFEHFTESGESIEVKFFNNCRDNFKELCHFYNNNNMFGFSDENLDEWWVQSDIQTYFDMNGKNFSMKITMDNIKKKLIEILAKLNKIGFFNRYYYGEYTGSDNENSNTKKYIFNSLEYMILVDLKGKSYITIN